MCDEEINVGAQGQRDKALPTLRRSPLDQSIEYIDLKEERIADDDDAGTRGLRVLE